MSEFPPPPDEGETLDLLGRIRGGEGEAWNDLYRRYHDQLLLTIRARLGSGLRRHMQSEDVLQSVALEAFRDLDGFAYRGPGSLRHFLNKLVLNKIRDRADHFGALKRAGDTPLGDTLLASVPDPATEPTYHDAERYGALERSLARLPEDLREVLLLRRVDGLPSREVAELLGRSDEAVRKAYSRALAKLALMMRDAGH